MENIEYFHLKLDNETGFYKSGEMIAGSLVYKLNCRLKAHQVRLYAAGNAIVEWTEGQGRKNVATFNGREDYMSMTLIFQNERERDDFFLEQGVHEHPFQVQIPPSAPSSLEHSQARVRYTLFGIIDIPWAVNIYVQRIVSVVKPYDLNLIPGLREPYAVSVTTNQRTGGCCNKKAPVNATLSVRKGGYVSGEVIVCDVQIQNQTTRQQPAPVLSLCQQLVLNSAQKMKMAARVAVSAPMPWPVAASQTENYTNVELAIPSVPPSTLNDSRVIIVGYYLSLNLDPAADPTLASDLRIPITVGTVPMAQGDHVYNRLNQYSLLPSVFGGIENAALDRELTPTGELRESNQPIYLPYYSVYNSLALKALCC